MVATNGDGKGAVIVNGYCDLFTVCVCDCVFRHFFGGRVEFSPPKTYNCPPQAAVKMCAQNLFFGRSNEL